MTQEAAPMAWSLYPKLRGLLFSLDPESAHDLSLKGLDYLSRFLPLALPPACPTHPEPVTLAGLVFPNRVGLAAGLDKNAQHIDSLARFGFGFMEVGTVTPRPQPGNPRPRLFRLESAEGLINRFGFNNLGLEAFVRQIKNSHWVRDRRGILGLNIGKNASTSIDRAEDDYLEGLRGVYEWADYITINISSPNTKNLRDLQGPEALEKLLAALVLEAGRLRQHHQKRVPLFVKIAPDLDERQVEEMAKTIARLELDGVIATNTTLDRASVVRLAHADEAGGLSGAPLKERAKNVLAQLRARLPREVVLIGAGGIMSAQDGLDRRAAGADLLQLYTGLIYHGPQLVLDLAKSLCVDQRA